MNQSLLICIAYHHVPERLKWLRKVVGNLLVSYQVSLTIIIDTNIVDVEPIWDVIGKTHTNVSIVSHPDLDHPFYLTRMHRLHMQKRIDEFDVVMYVEDDEVVPFENYIAALKKYDMMCPHDAVPTFVRIEEADGKQYISDIPTRLVISTFEIICIDMRYFVAIPFPVNYHGFWLMPTKYLKGNMITDFTKMSDAREWGAMYPTWELNKRGLLEIHQENGRWQIHPNCYAYHLPNNYVGSSMGNGTIEVKNVFA